MTIKPDIVTVLRAAAVIPGDISPTKFRALLFEAATLIEDLRSQANVADRGTARDAETITDLREALAVYAESAKPNGPEDKS